MEKFILNLSSPSWWISVVLVGVIVSVLGAFLKDYVEKIMSILFENWTKRQISNKEFYENQIVMLIKDSDMRAKYRFEVLRSLVISLIFTLLSITIFISSLFFISIGIFDGAKSIVLSIPALLSFMYGFGKLFDKKYGMLLEAEKRQNNNKEKS